MKIAVIGSTGMLGSQVAQMVRRAAIELSEASHATLDITDGKAVEALVEREKPNIIINCAGIVRGREDISSEEMFEVNTQAPLQMSDICDEHHVRMVQISTDCVFNGNGPHHEYDMPNAEDDYGRSKSLGEIGYGGHLTIRCSFVGLGKRGLVAWLLQQRGSVQGYRKVLWNGLTAKYAAQAIVALAQTEAIGILHMFGDDMTKCELLGMINSAFNLGLEIVPVDTPILDHRLRSISSYLTFWPPMEVQLKEMADAYCYHPSGS